MKNLLYIFSLLLLFSFSTTTTPQSSDTPPKEKVFGNYRFVSTDSDSGATLSMYYNKRQLLYWTTPDGLFDTIVQTELNNDNIPDFLFENAVEDGSTLYALISVSKRKFEEKKVSDNFRGIRCSENNEVLTHLQPLTIKDVNNNGNNEIIVNLIKSGENLSSISCTDTFYIDGK